MTWLQHWTDVLFLHFPVARAELAARIPRRLEIDTFDGQAWLSYVFFRLKLRPPWLPPVPRFSSLLELNVRTYVRHRGQAGICFLRMYADNSLAIRAARLLTPLRYEPATMIDTRLVGGARHIECRPIQEADGLLMADFSVHAASTTAHPGSLDAWLLERYRLFVGADDGRIFAADVAHPPWRTLPVELGAFHHNLRDARGLSLDAKPACLHYSPGVAARFNAFHVVAAEEINAEKVHQPAHAIGHHGVQ